MVSWKRVAPVGAVVLAVVLAGCSSQPAEEEAGSEAIAVVSSLDVWGDVVAVVGGDAVEVTSIIDRPEKDPHEYEATTQDQLALSRAELVIENGGGFDDFVTRMIESSGSDDATVLTVADVTDAGVGDEERNEHFWYDFASVKDVAAAVAETLSELDPDNAAMFEENLAGLNEDLDTLIARTEQLQTDYAGTPIGITEPLAYYLLEAIGLDNLTPEEVSEALEEGSDVPPALMLETLELYSSGAVEVLVYKEQRVGPQNEQILAAAEDNDIPVAYVQETFEPDSDYITWMNQILDNLQTALES